jgi:hypothetical protein
MASSTRAPEQAAEADDKVETSNSESTRRETGQELRGLDGKIHENVEALKRANEVFLRDHGGHWY